MLTVSAHLLFTPVPEIQPIFPVTDLFTEQNSAISFLHRLINQNQKSGSVTVFVTPDFQINGTMKLQQEHLPLVHAVTAAAHIHTRTKTSKKSS